MLENCSNLMECEGFLVPQLAGIEFLGQIELTREDIEKLGTFIKEKINPDISEGTRFLEERTPASFCCYLVGEGIWSYHSGDFWTSVQQTTGILDVFWQTRWGNIFLKFLQDKKLYNPVINSTYRYVAPILLHGGIPQNCLFNFFNNVIWPAVEQVGNAEAIILHRYQEFIDQENNKFKIEKEIKELEAQEKQLLQTLQDAKQLEKLSQKASGLEEITSNTEMFLLDEYRSSYDKKQEKLKNVLAELECLKQKKETYYQSVNYYKEKQKVLEYSSLIKKCKQDFLTFQNKKQELFICRIKENVIENKLRQLSHNLWQVPWEDKYGELLGAISWDALHQMCNNYNVEYDKWNKLVNKDNHFDYSNNYKFNLFLFAGILLSGIGIGFGVLSSWTLLVNIINILAILALGWGIIRLYIKKRTSEKEENEFKNLQQERAILEHELQFLQAKISDLLNGLPVPNVYSEGLFLILDKLYKLYLLKKDCSFKKEEIKDQLLQWENQVKEIAAALDIDKKEGPEQLTKELIFLLNQAHRQNVDVENLIKQLEQDINPRIQELEEQKYELKNYLTNLEHQISNMGNGDFNQGVKNLEEKNEAFKELENINYQIEQLILKLGQDVGDAKNQEKIEDLVANLETNLLHIRKNKVSKRRQLNEVPTVFIGLDEPVHRFLFYGNKWAETWLVASIKLMMDELRQRDVSTTPYGLPVRVRDALKKWKEKYKPPKPEITQQRFFAPSLILNEYYEIKLYLGKQRFAPENQKIESGVKVQIIGQLYGDTEELPVKAFLNHNGMVETEPVEYLIPHLKENYQVFISMEDKILRSWNFSVLNESMPFIIFNAKGVKLSEESLLPEKVWVLLPRGSNFHPEVKVVEEVNLNYVENNLYLAFVDLGKLRNVYFVSDLGETFILPVSANVKPNLSGGNLIDGVNVNGDSVYAGALPEINFTTTNIDQWKLLVNNLVTKESKTYKLKDLSQDAFYYNNGQASICLSSSELLGVNSLGRYSIAIYNIEIQEEFQFSIAILPSLEVYWEPEINFPVENEFNSINLTVITWENAEFVPFPPAEIWEKKDDAHEISVNSCINEVSGELIYNTPDGKKVNLSLTCRVPKIYWRLEGIGKNEFILWSHSIGKIWIGDFRQTDKLHLQVSIPEGIGKKVQLYLPEINQKITESIKNSIVKFNLLVFADTLNNPEKPVYSFTLKILDQRNKVIGEGILLHIRCRWEVYNINCAIENKPESRQLKIEWEEKGEAQDRILRLWRMWEPWYEPMVYEIPDKNDSLEIQVKNGVLPSGHYLMQFDVEDPWNGANPVNFPADSLNCKEFTIDDGKPFIYNLSIERLSSEIISIQGIVANINPGRKLNIVLISVVQGEIKKSEDQAVIGDNNDFGVKIEAKDKMHWLVIQEEGNLVFYHISVLSEPAVIEWPMAGLYENCLTSMILESPACKVILKHQEKRLGQYVLNIQNKEEFVAAFLNGEKQLYVILKTGKGVPKNYKLIWDENNKAHIELERKDVLCTTCGEIVSDQETWDRYHYPKCKSLIPNVDKIDISLYITWDYSHSINSWREKFLLAKDFGNLLFCNDVIPLPESTVKVPGNQLDIEALVPVLLEREYEVAKILLRGESLNGY